MGNWIAGNEVCGLRSKDAKLICYPSLQGGPFWEFFDLRKDSREMNNRFAAPEEQRRVAEHRARLRALADSYQDRETVGFLDRAGTSAP